MKKETEKAKKDKEEIKIQGKFKKIYCELCHTDNDLWLCDDNRTLCFNCAYGNNKIIH